MQSVPVLCGPTASGKSAAALDLFAEGSELISADSVQVYRGMDVGSAKPSSVEMAGVPHHLIDILDPDQAYSAGEFYRDTGTLVPEILQRGKHPVVVGGTGLYLKTLINGFFDGPAADMNLRAALERREKDDPGCLHRELTDKDPEAARHIQTADLRRTIRALEVLTLTGTPVSRLRRENTRPLEHRFRIAGIIHDRDVLVRRIRERAEFMLRDGLIGETEALLAAGYGRELPSMQTLGYRHACARILDGISDADTLESLVKDTVAFARRQIMLFKKIPGLVWFNGMDRDGLRRYFSTVDDD